MNIAASPLRADACGCLSCLDQQEAQQRIALFADVPQLLLASTGVLARNHPHVAADLLATSEPLRRPEDQHICQCCEWPTPGCVINRNTSGRFLASFSTADVNSSIVGWSRSSRSSNSRRRRLAQGPSASFSSSARPCGLHSFLQRLPSFMANAWS